MSEAGVIEVKFTEGCGSQVISDVRDNEGGETRYSCERDTYRVFIPDLDDFLVCAEN